MKRKALPPPDPVILPFARVSTPTVVAFDLALYSDRPPVQVRAELWPRDQAHRCPHPAYAFDELPGVVVAFLGLNPISGETVYPSSSKPVAKGEPLRFGRPS